MDEPEARLHPLAVRSVAEWLRELSTRVNGVFVATHHPIFLNLPDSADVAIGQPRLAFLRRSEGKTGVTLLSGSALAHLDQLVDEVGMTRAELMQLVRLALFVEGQHEVAFLTHLVGPELLESGIRIFAVRGTHDALALVDSDLLGDLGVRIAVLTDHTNVDNVRNRQPLTGEERAVVRLLNAARATNRAVEPFGLAERDVCYYLDEEICRRRAPKFPGWEAVSHAWSKEMAERQPARRTGVEFKRWVGRNYGLHLVGDEIGVIAGEMRVTGRIPPDITYLVRSIVAYAAGVPPEL